MSLPPDSPSEPATARFVTFGCKVNQYDTEVLRERAREAGVVETEEDADVVVVNTCTVTEHGGARARKAVRRIARENPRARIYVTGCYAVSDPETVAALPNVSAVVGNEEKEDLIRILSGRPSGTAFIEERVGGMTGRTRAFVKVQDGCPLRCTYCIVPAVRPRVTSKRADTVVEEVRSLVSGGHREAVLTGVHLGAYGRDRGGGSAEPLTDLVRRVLAETGIERIRLSSVEANEVTDDLLSMMAAGERLAPHLHLPLQAGSKAVLSRMRRRYDPERFHEVVLRVRDRIPDCAITTDVIVGFPGESEEDFEATLDSMRRAEFMKTHVFPFSSRPGTPAAGMDGKVQAREIRRRVEVADRLGKSLADDFAGRFVGRTVRVLFETRRRAGRLTGFSGRYVRVLANGPSANMNRILPVRVTGRTEGGLTGEIT